MGANSKGERKRKIAQKHRETAEAKREKRSSQKNPAKDKKKKGLPYKSGTIENQSNTNLRAIIDKKMPGWKKAKEVLQRRGAA